MFFFRNFCKTYMPCRESHSSIATVTYISRNRKWLIWFQSLTFFSKYLSLTCFFSCSQLEESSPQPQLFYFQGQLRGGLTSTKNILSVFSSEALILRCSLMKYGTSIERFLFKMAVLNVLGKWAFNMWRFAINDFLGISWKSSKQLFQKTQLERLFWFCLIIP